MSEINRRAFVKKSGFAAAVGSVAFTAPPHVLGANERIVLGCMGLGGRGSWLSRAFARQKNVEVRYVSDADAGRLENRADQVEEVQGKRPKIAPSFRTMLEDADVDAIVNATPDHWHALGTVLACQAGKHVYVEKPASHNIWEGRKMVEAARKYKRVVQLGTQTRSAPYAQHAVDAIRSGLIGDIHLVKVFNMKTRGQLKALADAPTPDGVNYDLWLGPAPMRPFNENHFRGGRWNWKWEYSGGDIINDGIHQIDFARWASMRRSPKTAYSIGGIWELKDKQDTPDTQTVLLEFEGLTMLIEVTLWTPYMKKTPPSIRTSDTFPEWAFNATKVEVYGTKGMMILGRHGGGWKSFDADGIPGPFEYGKDPADRHMVNFLDCIRKGGKPNADIEKGHLSTTLCHLANISYRLGGRKLNFDSKTERFIDDDEANRLVKRTYRSPWIVPEEV